MSCQLLKHVYIFLDNIYVYMFYLYASVYEYICVGTCMHMYFLFTSLCLLVFDLKVTLKNHLFSEVSLAL